jgi:hypothetical protein
MRDPTGAAEEVAAERARVAAEGTGAGCSLRHPTGGGAARRGPRVGFDDARPDLLRDLGLDPVSDQARRAVGLVRDRVAWKDCSPREAAETPSRRRGRALHQRAGRAVGAYFGQDVWGIVDRLLAEQLPDGGWNSRLRQRLTRSSFNTTICVLEALLEYERAVRGSPEVTRAVSAGRKIPSAAFPPEVDRRGDRARSRGRRVDGFASRRGGITTCCGA